MQSRSVMNAGRRKMLNNFTSAQGLVLNHTIDVTLKGFLSEAVRPCVVHARKSTAPQYYPCGTLPPQLHQRLHRRHTFCSSDDHLAEASAVSGELTLC